MQWGKGGDVFFNPKILIKASSSMELLNLLDKLSQTHISAILCSYDYFCAKGAKNAQGGKGGAFLNPKILIKASPSMGTTKSLCQAVPNTCF